MKLLVLTLSVAILFTAGEALRCHRCVPKDADGICTHTVETCASWKKICAAVVFMSEPYVQYQECMDKVECENLKGNTWMDVKCCTEDMCNTYRRNIG